MKMLVASALSIACAAVPGASAEADKSLDPKVFSSVRSEAIDFAPFPVFPKGAKLAVVVGEPKEPGPYVVRVMVPEGVKLMPHVHPGTASTRSFRGCSTLVMEQRSTLQS